MFDLAGKGALITGASGGIGSAIARALAVQGASVALSGTRVDVLEALAAEIGDSAVVVPADLSKDDETDGLVAAAEKQLATLDILVVNAGITRDGLALRMSDQEWQQVIQLNLTSSFRLIRSSLRGMMKRRWGRIIGISSVVGVTGNAGQSNYVASKAGMIGLIKALAQELARRNITANCVAPGMIETEMTRALPEERRQAILDAIPTGRLGVAEDVAASVVYLASQEASYVTGQTLHVNGGLAMI